MWGPSRLLTRGESQTSSSNVGSMLRPGAEPTILESAALNSHSSLWNQTNNYCQIGIIVNRRFLRTQFYRYMARFNWSVHMIHLTNKSSVKSVTQIMIVTLPRLRSTCFVFDISKIVLFSISFDSSRHLALSSIWTSHAHVEQRTNSLSRWTSKCCI